MTDKASISVYHFVRTFLRMSSDETFLSCLDSIDFRNHYVNVKGGYWKAFVYLIKTELINENLSRILRNLKLMFLDRFRSVSAVKLKKFMFGSIFNSFINFKNLLRYTLSYMRNGNPERKDLEKLRKTRYFEKKAKRHYDRIIRDKQLDQETEKQPSLAHVLKQTDISSPTAEDTSNLIGNRESSFVFEEKTSDDEILEKEFGEIERFSDNSEISEKEHQELLGELSEEESQFCVKPHLHGLEACYPLSPPVPYREKEQKITRVNQSEEHRMTENFIPEIFNKTEKQAELIIQQRRVELLKEQQLFESEYEEAENDGFNSFN